MSLSSILVAQGSEFLWALFGDGVHFGDVHCKNYFPFGTQNLKSRKTIQNTVSRKQSRKSVVPEHPKTANNLFSTLITTCFERLDILKLEVFWYPFGSLLESLFDTVGKKVGFGSSKTGVQQNHREFMKKGVPRALGYWV